MENRGKDGIRELRVLSICSVRIYLVLLEFIENRGKDGIWELRVSSTCSMNSQSLPYFSGINSLKKWKIWVKIGYVNLGYIPLTV